MKIRQGPHKFPHSMGARLRQNLLYVPKPVSSCSLPAYIPFYGRRQHSVEILSEGRENNFQGLAKSSDFHDIQPPLSALAFADEGLGFPQPGC